MARLNAARREKQRGTTSTLPSEPSEASNGTTEQEEKDRLNDSDSNSDDSDMDVNVEFNEERAQEIFDDFIVVLPRDVRRMLSVILMESFKKKQKMQVVSAATEAGSIMGYNERTVRKYRDEFYLNKGELEETKRGKYARFCIYHDEEINRKAAAWVRENAFQKGAPNMTAYSFCEWVNNNLLPASHLPPQYPRLISVSTAIRWLKHLGFKPRSHKKGVYIDGHEHDDVLKHRKSFLKKLATFRKLTNHHLCVLTMPHMFVMRPTRIKNSLSLFTMTSLYTIRTRDNRGCGRRKTIQPFCPKLKKVA